MIRNFLKQVVLPVVIAVVLFLALMVLLVKCVRAQNMDPALLEAYAALERPTEAALEQGRAWQRAGDTGTLYRPAAWVMQSCGDPLGCIMFTPGLSRTRAFCTMVLPRELPEFMEEAVADVRLAECGAVLTVANN